MIFSINREKLLNELSKVSRIVNIKSPIPSLTGVLIEAKKDRLLLISSDGNTSIKIEIKLGESDLNIKMIGSVLIKARYFNEIIRKIEDDSISVEVVDNNIIKINAHNFDSMLNIMNASNYPILTFNPEGKEIILPSKQVIEIIDQTIFAVGEKEKRIVLTGVNFKSIIDENNNSILSITATDSHRIANKKISYNHSEQDIDVIIPSKFVREISKLLFDIDENIKFICTDRSIALATSDIIIQSKTIEGKYPEISKIIPENFSTLLKMKVKNLVKVIDRASVISNEVITIVNLKIKENKLYIISNIHEIGNSEEQIDDFYADGPDQNVAFNARYMMEALKAFETEEIIIKIVDENSPIVIVSENEPSLFQLVLPVRLY